MTARRPEPLYGQARELWAYSLCMHNPLREDAVEDRLGNDRDDVVVRGLSTRPVKLRGESYVVRFTREALVGMTEQVRSGFVLMNVEHLSYLPPIGRWYQAEVEDDEEGESELVMYGRRLSGYRTPDGVLPEASDMTALAPDAVAGVEISLESRNFDRDVWESLSEDAPLPTRSTAAWSSLPPLVWLITVPVVWGVGQFAGSFMKRLGERTADGLVILIKKYAPRARDNERESLVEARFEVARGLSVSAFLPFDHRSGTAVAELRDGLDGLGPVAAFAGSMTDDPQPKIRRVAFFREDGTWRLGWWASTDAVHVTEWFEHNCPDPKRFLGRPVLGLSREPDPHQRLDLPSEP